MKIRASITALVLVSTFLATHIAEASSYYVTLSGGVAKLRDYCANSATGYTCTDLTKAYGLDLGYEYGDYIGSEFGYRNYGVAKTSGPTSTSVLDLDQKMSGVRLFITGNLPLSSFMAVTGKIGVAYNFISLDTTITPGPTIGTYNTTVASAAYGVGLKLTFSDSFSLRVQYEYLGKIGDDTTGTDTLTLTSVGLSYHFGQSKSRSYNKKSENLPSQPMSYTSNHSPIFISDNSSIKTTPYQ